MSKKKLIGIILLTAVIMFFLNIFFGRFLSAKISTWPLVNKFNILNPLTPIVITQRQEVRVSDTGDVLAALDSAKPKLSSLILKNENDLTLRGGLVNITSDGLFVTSASVVGTDSVENLYVKLEDGRTAQVNQFQTDLATGLVIVRADIDGVPVANLGDSGSVLPGQKVIFVSGSFIDHSPVFQNSFVSQSQTSNISDPRDAGFPRRSFTVQVPANLVNGQAVVDMSGSVMGLWDGKEIVSSSVIKNLVDSYLNGQHIISRPAFGFNYKVISALDSRLLGIPEGVLVLAIAPASAAFKAGLLDGDVITQVNNDKLDEQNQLEEILQKYKPADAIKLTVFRAANTTTLTLIVGELR